MTLDLQFWQSIDRIRSSLFIDDHELCDLLDLSSQKIQAFEKVQRIPDLGNVTNLCDRLGITLDDVFENNFDEKALKARYLGDRLELPKKYDFAKFSKTRTIINILDHLKSYYGAGFVTSLLKSMQIDPRFFESPDNETNIFVISDLCQKLKELGLRDEDFINFGRSSYKVYRNSSFGDILKSHSDPVEMLDDLCSNYSSLFDKNFDYKVTRANENEISIDVKPSEQAKDLLGTNYLTNSEACLTKLGVFETFPLYIGLHARAEKSKCIYQGDEITEYKISI